jgi:hypothetical protein
MPNTNSVATVAPILVLALVLGLLIFFPIPVPNRDVVMTIVAGLLGYLSRGERHVPADTTTVTTPAPADVTVTPSDTPTP